MADGLPKVNVAAAINVPLAAAAQGVQAVGKLAEKHKVGEKLAQVGGLKEHRIVKAAFASKELLLVGLGLVLTFHGAQFKNIVLCTQLVISFLLTRLTNSVSAIYGDLSKVAEKAEADAPEPLPAKDEADDKSNKHAKKREAKKNEKDKAAVATVDPKVHLEAAKKMLKTLDSDRLTTATKEVLLCLMACLLVLHGGLAQNVAIAHSLVGFAALRIEAFVEFEGFEDISPWTALMMHVVLWAVMLPFTWLFSNVALILNVSIAGAQLAFEHGAAFLAMSGKIEDSTASATSLKGLAAFGGLLGAGFLWQVWTLAAGGGLYWIFWLAYLPAVIVEALLGCL